MVKILVQMAKLSTLQSSDIVGFLFSHEKKSFHGFLLIEVVIRMVTLDWRELIMQVEEEPYLQIVN